MSPENDIADERGTAHIISVKGVPSLTSLSASITFSERLAYISFVIVNNKWAIFEQRITVEVQCAHSVPVGDLVGTRFSRFGRSPYPSFYFAAPSPDQSIAATVYSENSYWRVAASYGVVQCPMALRRVIVPCRAPELVSSRRCARWPDPITLIRLGRTSPA